MDSEVGSGRNRPSDRVIIHKDHRRRFWEKAEAIVGTVIVAVVAEVVAVTLIVAIDLVSRWSLGIWTEVADSARSVQEWPSGLCQVSPGVA